MSGVTSRRAAIGALLTTAAGVAGFLVARASGLNRRKVATPSYGSSTTGGTPTTNGYGPTTTSPGTLLARLDQVPPTGGGLILSQALVVLVREKTGTVRGFSATCTHEGCTVNSVTDGVIMCPCHGSRFSAATGAVINGPATLPLPPVAVSVRRGEVFRV